MDFQQDKNRQCYFQPFLQSKLNLKFAILRVNSPINTTKSYLMVLNIISLREGVKDLSMLLFPQDLPTIQAAEEGAVESGQVPQAGFTQGVPTLQYEIAVSAEAHHTLIPFPHRQH